MIEDDRRLLTEEVLGEKWHKFILSPKMTIPTPSSFRPSQCSCGNTGYSVIEICSKANRTFTTWQDTGDLKERIVEMGEWRDFALFAAGEWDKTLTLNPTENFIVEVFTDWLMDPIRFPELVVGWVRERGKG